MTLKVTADAADAQHRAITDTSIMAGTRYVTLHTQEPTEANPNELNGSGYARQTIADAAWENATVGNYRRRRNNGQIDFPSPSANWSEVSHVALWAGIPGAGGAVLLWIWDVADVTPMNGANVSIADNSMYVETSIA